MRYRACMIAWQPKGSYRSAPEGSVKVGLLANAHWSVSYLMTSGGCFTASRTWPAMQAVLQVLMDFNTLTVRDDIDPAEAHREFLRIDEYQFMISTDCPGAEDWPDWFEAEIGAWQKQAGAAWGKWRGV